MLIIQSKMSNLFLNSSFPLDAKTQAFQTDQDMIDLFPIYHELPGFMLGLDKYGKETAPDPYFKNRNARRRINRMMGTNLDNASYNPRSEEWNDPIYKDEDEKRSELYDPLFELVD